MDDDIIIQKNEVGEDIYVFDPYNTENIEITRDDVQRVLKKYGIDVQIYNFELYKRAFIHRSYTKRPNLENSEKNIIIATKPENTLELHTKSNERLEFIGDGVLECITKYYLYRRFPKENEGFMTEKDRLGEKMNLLVKSHKKWGFINGLFCLKMRNPNKYAQMSKN